MHVLILGAAGQVGEATHALLSETAGYRVTALAREALDLTDRDAVHGVVERERPDAVINAAAYTAVDRAESEPERAHAVNAQAPGWLAAACAARDSLLVHYSTDYVFDGENDRPWTEDDPVGPCNVYGQTKLEGERAVLGAAPGNAVILRTSWVYAPRGRNFLGTMLRLAAERETLPVVDDQHGSPTSAGAIADATLALLVRRRRGEWRDGDAGIYHASCSGQTTWCGFARHIFKLAGLDPRRVHGITTAEFPTPARRPRYSVLDCSRLQARFGVTMPHWEHAQARCMQERGDASGG